MVTEQEARLRITGPETENHTVPTEVLVHTLEGMQQTVWLLAASREGLEIHQRFKPSAEFRKRHTLRCAVPEGGSYAIPLTMAEESFGLLGDVHTLWSALLHRNFEQLKQLVPDSAFRQRVLREVQKFLPKRGDSWGLAFSSGGREEVELGPKARLMLEQELVGVADAEERHETTSVIGHLVRIDFPERKVVLQYPPTHKEIDCVYLPEVEESILKARRGLFQVTGHFILDEEGHPKKLTEVSDIEPVDLSPMSFTSLEHGKDEYVLTPPLVLTPSLDAESQQYFVAELPLFNLHVHGRTRDALVDELSEQLAFLWREYAEAEPSSLAEDALRLREALLQHVSRQHG